MHTGTKKSKASKKQKMQGQQQQQRQQQQQQQHQPAGPFDFPTSARLIEKGWISDPADYKRVRFGKIRTVYLSTERYTLSLCGKIRTVYLWKDTHCLSVERHALSQGTCYSNI